MTILNANFGLNEQSARRAADPLPVVLEELHTALEESGTRYALIGGVACSVLGRPRNTKDIDIFIRPVDADPVLDLLADRGFETDRLDPKWIYKAHKDSVTVDVIFSTGRGGIYFDEEVEQHARFGCFRGVEVRMVAPEDLLVIKTVAHDEATPRHWHDALGLIVGSELDWDYLLHRARFSVRRVLSLLLYAQSLDYAVPGRVIRTLAQRVCNN